MPSAPRKRAEPQNMPSNLTCLTHSPPQKSSRIRGSLEDRHKLTPGAVLVVAVWFAMLTGLGEVSVIAVQKFLFDRYVHASPYVVWTVPLANLFSFAVLGWFVICVARYWPWLVPLRIVAFLFALVGFVSLLLIYPALHRYAALLLGAGLAVQTARLIAARSQGFYRLVRHSTPWMLAFVVVLASTVHARKWLEEQRALANLPAASANAPNVILIVLDTVRAQSLSAYGHARRTTPQLERLAKTGVLFERAISTSSWTLPSHAAMFTGRYLHEVSADWTKPLDTTYSTLAEVLSARGYLTAGFVANTIFCTTESGLGRGFAHYEDFSLSFGEILTSSSLGRSLAVRPKLRKIVGYYDTPGRKSAADLNSDFLGWLARQERRPFFVFLNYFDAHHPYLPPEPFDLTFGPKTPRRNPFVVPRQNWSPHAIQAELNAYEGSIRYLDQQVGLLFDELERRILIDNTLVIITADHGEEFGEHDLFEHGHSLYLPSLHVPLVLLYPSRVPGGLRVSEPVSLRDIPATVIDLIGLFGEVEFPGNSLARYWDAARKSGRRVAQPLLSEVNVSSNVPSWFPVAKGNMKALLSDEMHYVRNGDGSEELYDLRNDPQGKNDLSASREAHPALQAFRRALETILGETRS